MLKIKDNVDLISKLDISNKKEQQEEFEEYIENLTELYEKMIEALDNKINFIHFAWLSDLPDVARKLKFKVWENPIKEFGGCITITKRGIKKITKEMIKYDLVEKVKE